MSCREAALRPTFGHTILQNRIVGAKHVFPGPQLGGESLRELVEGVGVTFPAGVPTIWQGLLAYLESSGGNFPTMLFSSMRFPWGQPARC